MQKPLIQLSGKAAAAAAIFLLATFPVLAANSVLPVAQELEQRNRMAEAASGAPKDHLSESAVRVMLSFAYSVLPNEYQGADGKTVKVDKSDPNRFFIPIDDARQIIRAATRSAYAEVCNLPDLERANYKTLMDAEAARKVWTEEQLMFINALHMFAVSYFTGNLKITAKTQDAGTATASKPDQALVSDLPTDAKTAAAADQAAPAAPAETAAKENPATAAAPADPGSTETFALKRPTCTPEQKEKVTQAINAYVQAAKAETPAAAASPAAGKGD